VTEDSKEQDPQDEKHIETTKHEDTLKHFVVMRIVKDYQYVMCGICRPKLYVYMPKETT
jgi:hypothetical protein